MTFIRKCFSSFFSAPAQTTWKRTILWWEVRRIPYNLFVASAAVLSFLIFFFSITHSGVLKPGEDAEEPIGILFAVIVGPIAVNLLYTLGWLVELLLRRLRPSLSDRFAPALLAIGLLFSAAVIFLPAMLGLLFLAASYLHS